MNIDVLPKAQVRLGQLLSDKPDQCVRVSIRGGGCSGFEYDFEITSSFGESGDVLFEGVGWRLVVDPISLGYLDGADLDYIETLMSSGFEFRNPQATAHCGCGKSFAMG